jgi:predicted secreted protein
VKFFVVFASVWWVVFFMALPFGVKVPEKKEDGFADSAPQNPLILKKIIYTTILSLLISLAIIYAMGSINWTQAI